MSYDDERPIQTSLGDISALGMPVILEQIVAGKTEGGVELIFLMFTSPAFGGRFSFPVIPDLFVEFCDRLKKDGLQALEAVQNLDVYNELELQAMLASEDDVND